MAQIYNHPAAFESHGQGGIHAFLSSGAAGSLIAWRSTKSYALAEPQPRNRGFALERIAALYEN